MMSAGPRGFPRLATCTVPYGVVSTSSLGRVLQQETWDVGSTVSFFLGPRNTKLYEKFAYFDRFAKYEIKCFQLFRETEKTFRFVVSHIFIEILYLLFEFCTFHSSFVPFIRFSYLLFKFCTFFELHRYILNPSMAITTFIFKQTFRSGKEGCRKEEIQVWREIGKEGNRTGGILDWRDSGLE